MATSVCASSAATASPYLEQRRASFSGDTGKKRTRHRLCLKVLWGPSGRKSLYGKARMMPPTNVSTTYICIATFAAFGLLVASAHGQGTTTEREVTGFRANEPEATSTSATTDSTGSAADSVGRTQDDGFTDSGCNTTPAGNTVQSSSELGNFSHWAVATDAALCANVSRNIFQKGGNLADVAVATMLCMGVTLPHNMGIGGGFVATIYLRCTRQALTLIARESAPAASSRDMFVGNKTLATRGGLSVAVPGELRGYQALLRELHGALSWREHFEDAIRLARHGFPVGPHLAATLQRKKHDLSDSLKKVFWNEETNDTLSEGELLVQRDLADTLEAIADKGPDYFYKGDFAEATIKEIRQSGGVLTMSDLKRYSVSWETPVRTSFQDGRTLYSVPAPASGAVLAYILGIMDGFRLSPDDMLPDDGLTLHRFVEACKFAYAQRGLLGDGKFVKVEELQHLLTSPDFAAVATKLINDSCTHDDPTYYGFVNESQVEDSGTAHATFWGDNGDVISITSTVNNFFGSQVRTASGVILNNEMDDFSTPGMSNSYGIASSRANYIEPRKRPVSSMVPSVIVNSNGDAELAVGGGGGSKITSGVAQVVVRTLWQGDNIKEAIDSPRVHHQLFPNEASVEDELSEEYIAELEGRGHVVTFAGAKRSFISGISREKNRLYANADFRIGGSVDGE